MKLSMPIVQRPDSRFDDCSSRDPFNPYRVTQWACHPNENSHDCLGGEDYPDQVKALDAFQTEDTNYHVKYIVVEGPGLYRVRANRFYNAERIAQCDNIGFVDWFKAGEEPPVELAAPYP